MENIFGPILIEREVSPSLYPNTVPSVGKQRDHQRYALNGNSLPANSNEIMHNGLPHLSAYPPGRRRVQENVLYNKNRDLTIKPSPYSLSNNSQLFPWVDRDPSRAAVATNWIFDSEGGNLACTVEVDIVTNISFAGFNGAPNRRKDSLNNIRTDWTTKYLNLK